MKNVLTYTALAIALCFAAPAWALTDEDEEILLAIDAGTVAAIVAHCPNMKTSDRLKQELLAKHVDVTVGGRKDFISGFNDADDAFEERRTSCRTVCRGGDGNDHVCAYIEAK